MSNSKLILIEGIPGSGKTTTAQFVCDWLQQHDQRVVLFQEGDWNHPADFESVACLNDHEYDEIKTLFRNKLGFSPNMPTGIMTIGFLATIKLRAKMAAKFLMI